MTTKSKILTFVTLLIAVAFLGGKSLITSQNLSDKKGELARVQKGKLEEKLTISGKIAAEENVTLQFQTGGKLSWVGVKEGDYVQKYQAIASLDQREVQKKIDSYLNAYMKTRWDFEQTKEDNKDVLLTNAVKRTLEKSQFDLNNSVINVELQDLARQFANLWTPIEGIVIKADTPQSGVNIYLPTQAQFKIANPKTIFLEASADQTEVVKLKEGMEGDLLLDSYSDTTLQGKIQTIAFTPKEGETGTIYTIKFVFDNDNFDYKYRLGMTGDLSFVIKEKDNVLFIPSKFIKSSNGNKYVYVLRNKKTEKIRVETGFETDSGTEITSGLSEGETIHD
jgi:RND family efflux transporter MFP subunit